MVAKTDPSRLWSHLRLQAYNYSNACGNFKKLIPVGDPCLVAGEDISDVSWELRFIQEVELIPWFRQMHQASRFNQPIPELTRLMALFSNRLVWSRWKMYLEELLISKNLRVADTNRMQPLECLPYFLNIAAICFAETYLKFLPYHRQIFINFDQCFYPRLK